MHRNSCTRSSPSFWSKKYSAYCKNSLGRSYENWQSEVHLCLYLGHLESFKSKGITKKTYLVGFFWRELRAKYDFPASSISDGVLFRKNVVLGSSITIIFLNKVDLRRSLSWSLSEQICKPQPKKLDYRKLSEDHCFNWHLHFILRY